MGSYPSIIPESQVRWFLNEILKENLIGFSRFMLRTPYFFSGLEPSPCHIVTLILIMYFLGKAQDILDADLRPVVQDGRSAHPSEYLMLVGDDHLEIQVCRPIQDRDEIHLKPAV